MHEASAAVYYTLIMRLRRSSRDPRAPLSLRLSLASLRLFPRDSRTDNLPLLIRSLDLSSSCDREALTMRSSLHWHENWLLVVRSSRRSPA